MCNNNPSVTHISQVQDETVSLVEAVPADWHLSCPDNTTTFDLEHSLHYHLVGDDMLEARRHTSFLKRVAFQNKIPAR